MSRSVRTFHASSRGRRDRRPMRSTREMTDGDGSMQLEAEYSMCSAGSQTTLPRGLPLSVGTKRRKRKRKVLFDKPIHICCE